MSSAQASNGEFQNAGKPVIQPVYLNDPSNGTPLGSIANPLNAAVQQTASASGGYSYTNITTATTTLVKSGAGTLHAIIINTPVGNGVIESDDALTHTTPKIGTITFPATLVSDGPISTIYDIAFATGLSITTTGTMDITVAWK